MVDTIGIRTAAKSDLLFVNFPGTRNIPLGQLEAVLSEGPEKFSRKFHLSTYDQEEGMNVVFLCKAGVRAAKAAAIARKHGFIR